MVKIILKAKSIWQYLQDEDDVDLAYPLLLNHS